MAEDWANAVEDGLRLAKRIYFGKDRAVAPPKPITTMEKSALSYLPTAPMVYAVIRNPAIVDNPDIPSYQPHVHGRCDPPALIPLQMNGIALEADCYLDTAFVTITGSWRVHCVMGSRNCDCRIAIPMGEQGSILGVEVDIPRKSYCTQVVSLDNKVVAEKESKAEDGLFLKPHIFTFTIPQVDGGSNLSIKIRWSQKLLYHKGQLTLNVPFKFPEFVTPAGKKISKKEKIQLNVNSGPGTEVLFKTTSHPLKELRRQAGKFGLLYDSEVLTWSSSNFVFSYTVSAGNISGGVLLQSPSVLDSDQREMFCFYIFPGDQLNRKVFRKSVVFLVDISGSMHGKPLEDTKNALCAALSKLDPEDSFNVIAFNGEMFLFSSSLQLATKEAVKNVTEWINMNFVAGGGTHILKPLNQAIEMHSNTQNSIPIIFLITDGAVEEEKHICEVVKDHLTNKQSICPRIYTFGIGSFCNHYFLRMLAVIGRGHHDAAFDTDSIEARLEGLFARASSTILADISVDSLDGLDGLHELEVHPFCIPDLSESTLIVSGRYQGVFPDTFQVRGIIADMSKFALELKVWEENDIPLDKVLAKQQIELFTAQAWLSDNKELKEKVSNLSIKNCIVSEYTRMILIETERGKKATVSDGLQEVSNEDPRKMADPKSERIIVLQNLAAGFGSLTATADNTTPGLDKVKPLEPAEIFAKAASNCCGKFCGYCCCMCCIRACSQMNDQCAIALSQFCGGLACFGCLCCCEACCSGQDG